MKKCFMLIFMILLLFPMRSVGIDNPEIPRVSAYEVYLKYKAGKVILLHAGGEIYERRHIVGAFNMDVQDEIKDKRLPKFPKSGIEIITYCY